jgi:hypothetical protein
MSDTFVNKHGKTIKKDRFLHIQQQIVRNG